MKTRTKLEKIESTAGREERRDPVAERNYKRTVELLRRWDGDGQALLVELRQRNRYKPTTATTAEHDARAGEFVQLVNRVAERLRDAPRVQEWQTRTAEPKPRQSETARLLRLVK